MITKTDGKGGLGMNRVSRALKELSKEGLVECITPDNKRGRIYKRTKLGENLIKELRD